MTEVVGSGAMWGFCGTIVTMVGGIVVLVLNQRAQFREAAASRQAVKEETIKAAAATAESLAKETEKVAAGLKNHVEKVAADLVVSQSSVATTLEGVFASDRVVRDVKLDEIAGKVNGRLDGALNEIIALKKTIEFMVSMRADLEAERKARGL